MRRCPRCTTELIEAAFEGERVDRCGRCQGMFFDAGELESILGMMRLYGAAVLMEDEIPAVPDEELERRRTCPADGGPMSPRQIGALTIDVCARCSGVWLDEGELAALKRAEQHIRDNLNLYIRLGQ